MDIYKISSWICLFVFLSIFHGDVHGQSNNVAVTDFGAIADGKTDSKQAFENAWKKACNSKGGTVSVPRGVFFLSSGDFEGPCNGPTQLRVDGTVIASSEATGDDSWIAFNKVNGLTISGSGLTISGSGVFDGNGASSWSRCSGSQGCGNRPSLLSMNSVTNTIIQGIKVQNSKMFHIHIVDSDTVTVKNVRIQAPKDSPNTDGIHIGRSNGVEIFDSYIATGDDCISIGDGSTNVNISDVSCGPGHGISIGSLGKYQGERDVSRITVSKCTMSNTENGLRIKTWAPSQSSIVVSDVTFSDININNVDNPIIIDQHYCPNGGCSHSGESSVQIKGVKFINIKGTSAVATAVSIQCSRSKPCQDIEFSGLSLMFDGRPTNALCTNANGVFLGSDQVPSRCSSSSPNYYYYGSFD